ncbi:hypothetical protein FJO69_00785 [[Mycoplasma] falconis]|uniref:Asp23/Gls24 family envelope stress response protein n=1 Tax=[Mycoplasma] falconis TaxID=92403 RepID=A0A501XBB2_9BACT|nr:hypothetical protein [[Mycoplasma] falconis]TPE57719.1 hypothetical protein FJO69_00785 [[Mycoplasma] falconis]
MHFENLKEWIYSSLTSVAGIKGFAPLTPENGYNKENDGFVVEVDQEDENKINVYLGLILIKNINAKNIVEEIYEVVKYQLNKEGMHLSKILIYIKGTE